MTECGFYRALEFWDNSLSQHLAQFHAPLIERIDVPDDPLGEHIVFVQGHQLAEHPRRQPIGKQGVRGAVALEDPVRHEPICRTLGFHLFGRFPEGQRLALGEDVCQEQVMVPPLGVESMTKRNEIARDQPGPLMDQLVEGVLAVGSRLTPIDGTGRATDLGPVERDALQED